MSIRRICELSEEERNMIAWALESKASMFMDCQEESVRYSALALDIRNADEIHFVQ